MSYHDTVPETRDNLRKYKKIAKAQESRILEFFRQNPTDYFAPHQILSAVFPEDDILLTSVRRSMTDLTKDGYLEKTRYMIVGDRCRMVRTWKCAKKP